MPFRDETETVIHSDNDFATVAYVRVKAAHLEDKEPNQTIIRPPEIITEEFSQCKFESEEQLQDSPCGPIPHGFDASGGPMLTGTSTRRNGPWVLVNNVYRDPSNGYCSFKEEVYSCLASVRGGTHICR
jgi:diphthine-ammonia ligase